MDGYPPMMIMTPKEYENLGQYISDIRGLIVKVSNKVFRDVSIDLGRYCLALWRLLSLLKQSISIPDNQQVLKIGRFPFPMFFNVRNRDVWDCGEFLLQKELFLLGVPELEVLLDDWEETHDPETLGIDRKLLEGIGTWFTTFFLLF